MHLIALAWIYVVTMMALAEALSSQGTLLGAVITFFLYGLLPLGLVLYILATPARKRARRAAEAQQASLTLPPAAGQTSVGSEPPDGRGHAASDPAAAKREEA